MFGTPKWRGRSLPAVITALALAFGSVGTAAAAPTGIDLSDVTYLHQEDFRYGTYIIDKPGVYRLAEDITFDPNSPATLTAAAADPGLSWLAAALEWPTPVDAYHSGMPLFTQFGGTDDFSPGGLLAPNYDPAAYGVGFFAAIAISGDNVILDLDGHTIAQSPEHALLQRFFAVIELADQPFIPNQGPSGFGDAIDPAKHVVIENGTIGLASHHGIHGNGAVDVTIKNIDFVGYEVGAVALNGVDGLLIKNVTAENRKDIPVLGTFSSAQFVKPYIEELSRNGSPTTLTVGGVTLGVNDIKAGLRTAINNTYEDIITSPHIVDGRAQIDKATHPAEYALFNNPTGLLDGNSYSFLINQFGVAVDGFPTVPDGVTKIPSKNVRFRNVKVINQSASINEIPALKNGTAAVIDAVGAVFQVYNRDFSTGAPVTMSSLDPDHARFTGNAVANAQAFVAKAKANGEFASSNLSVTRVNLTPDMLAWVEGVPGKQTLTDIGAEFFCNGDSMFHVNKGVIAYKMDGVEGLVMTDTSVVGLHNLGAAGSSLCGDYLNGFSHPKANLYGYGGSTARAYTFAGSDDVKVKRATVKKVTTVAGPAIGMDVLTDSYDIRLISVTMKKIRAGLGGPVPPDSSTVQPYAAGFHLGPDAGAVTIKKACVTKLVGVDGVMFLHDEAGTAVVIDTCDSSI